MLFVFAAFVDCYFDISACFASPAGDLHFFRVLLVSVSRLPCALFLYYYHVHWSGDRVRVVTVVAEQSGGSGDMSGGRGGSGRVVVESEW